MENAEDPGELLGFLPVLELREIASLEPERFGELDLG
jgi:hypothetical protein